MAMLVVQKVQSKTFRANPVFTKHPDSAVEDPVLTTHGRTTTPAEQVGTRTRLIPTQLLAILPAFNRSPGRRPSPKARILLKVVLIMTQATMPASLPTSGLVKTPVGALKMRCSEQRNPLQAVRRQSRRWEIPIIRSMMFWRPNRISRPY